jgi:threonine 3-dehydrogenase
MKAVGKLREGPGIDVFDFERPKPGPNEVLVEVKATGICGTDLHFYRWDDYARKRNPGFPKVLGHEFSGIVVEVGEGVRSLKVGDKVAGEPHIPCGNCYYCRVGKAHICENLRLYGVDTLYGSFTKYTILPESIAVKIPDDIDFEVAALFEPFGVALHAVNDAEIRPGDVVVVLGCGPIGLYIQQLARLSGASKVIGVEVSRYRLELAAKVGVADELIDASTTDPIKQVLKLTNGRGADVVIEASGSVVAIKNSLEIAAKSGRIVQVGTASKYVEIDPNVLINKELRISGIFGRLMFDTWYKVIELVRSGKVNLLQVVTHKMPLEQAQEAFELLTRGEAGKILFIP